MLSAVAVVVIVVVIVVVVIVGLTSTDRVYLVLVSAANGVLPLAGRSGDISQYRVSKMLGHLCLSTFVISYCVVTIGGIALFIYFSKEFSGTRSRKHMSCYCISRNCKHKLQLHLPTNCTSTCTSANGTSCTSSCKHKLHLQTQVALAVAVAVAVAQVATRDDSKYVIFLVSRVESYLYGKEGCVGGGSMWVLYER